MDKKETKKLEAELNKTFKKRLEVELKRRVVGKGTPEEQKRKADWFKKHVIIDMGD